MPVIILLFALMLLPIVMVLAIPFGIVQRYRAGTTRRRVRSWLAATNAFFTVTSAFLFLGMSFITNIWIAGVPGYAATGLAAGGVLGGLGILLTRWHADSGHLEYTPNRWLVLLITTAISVRIVYGLWRTWNAWQTTPSTASWIAKSHLAESLGVGGVVIGYYAVYWLGIWAVTRKRLKVESKV